MLAILGLGPVLVSSYLAAIAAPNVPAVDSTSFVIKQVFGTL